MNALQNENLIHKTKFFVGIQLSRVTRFLIFLSFILLSVVMSADNGVLSSSKKMIVKDLNLSDSEYGTFGSIPSIGRIIGSLIFMKLLLIENRKYLTCICIIINGGMFFVYILTKNIYILFVTRFIIGVVRIYPHIYIPIWIDQFGIKSLKTFKLTILNISSPLGQIVGYAIGTFNPPEKWTHSFCLVGILILVIGSFIFFTPSKYFSSKYTFIGYHDGEKLVQTTNSKTKHSIFSSGEDKNENDNKDNKEKKDEGNMIEILKSKTFIFSSYTRANFLYIFLVIHLFITDYVENGLKIQDKKEILKYYGLASLMGPTIGGAIGGLAITYVGGYESKNSVFVMIAFGIFTLIDVFPLATTSNMMIFSITLFGFFFGGGAILPTIMGYAISSIPKIHKGAGSSLNLLISNLVGNTPGPIVYGFINDKFRDKDPTIAWKSTMIYYIFGFVSVLLACKFRYNDISSNEKNNFEKVSYAKDEYDFEIDDDIKAIPVDEEELKEK